jgi:pyruvate formate lyase activating enzyme
MNCDSVSEMREAKLYSTIPGGIRCDLCARRCVLGEGETGFCRVRVVEDGKLMSMVYGLIDGMAADPIEKKPLFHFAPGSKTFSISSSSCNFRCQFCLNYHSAHRASPVGETLTPEDIVKLAVNHDCAGITYTYTEPTVFWEFATDTAQIAHTKGIFNTIVTNGYMTPEAIEMMTPNLNAASINFKGSGNKDFYQELMSVPKVEPIYKSMEVLKEKGVFIEITNLIIPEVGDFEDDTRQMAEWVVDNLGPGTPFHIIAFAPTYKMTHLPRTPPSTLERHIQIAKGAGLSFVYSGNVAGHDYEDTYCPNCGTRAVERYSVFLKSNNLNEKGQCPECGTDLNMAGINWMVRGRARFF